MSTRTRSTRSLLLRLKRFIITVTTIIVVSLAIVVVLVIILITIITIIIVIAIAIPSTIIGVIYYYPDLCLGGVHAQVSFFYGPLGGLQGLIMG